MKILVTGSTGLVGSHLLTWLSGRGHQVMRLVRGEPGSADEVQWDPERGVLSKAAVQALDGAEALVHLSGEPVAAYWSHTRKQRILESRVNSTKLLSNTILKLQRPPKVWVCASAIGYYGDRGSEPLTEDSPPGVNFLAGVCRQWEDATRPASDAGVRVVNLRIGVVLSQDGGALSRMLPPFKLGLGGPLGSGRQYMSWIAIDDLVGAVDHAINTDSLKGPVNAVAPNPATNLVFSRALGKALGRPALLPAPAFALRLALGEMADELLLGSVRLEPKRLLASGFVFKYPELDGALRHLLAQTDTPSRTE